MISTNRSSALCAFLLAGAACFSLASCGSSDGSGDGGPLVGFDAVGPGQGGGGIVGTGGGASGGAGGGTPVKGGAGGAAGGLGGGGAVGSGGTGLGGLGGGGLLGSGGATVPACGQPGTACCNGNSCDGGGCCVSGICMAVGGSCVGLGGGICSAGACGNCGGPGFPCCGTNPASGSCTAAGTTCNAGTCAKCGEPGLPCCPGANGGAASCVGTDVLCVGNSCRVCGTPTGPCCPGNRCAGAGCCYDNSCVAEAASCGTSAGACLAGRCSGCGGASQPCCSTSQCYDGLLCKSGACTTCGGSGQPCCAAAAGVSACQTGMLCTSSGADGVCSRCGGLGDVCCAGNTCSDGCCVSGRCLATSACLGPVDGGSQPDAPVGGSGGNAGTGGIQGTGGVAGAGGTTVQTGGISGTGGVTTSTGGAGGTTLPPWTPPPGCGDGLVVAPERCDDGNTTPFDGCSSDCQYEPRCVGSGPCTSSCGDGIVVGEDCDDGNLADGDGCSSACKVEAGFLCEQPALGGRILVPAVYRDFKFQTPKDFEAGVIGSEKASIGMVNLELDTDGKPVFSGVSGSAIHVTSKDTFATWYRDTAGTNHATESMLALWDNGSGAYVNRYGANGERWAITETAIWCGNVGEEILDGAGNPIPCTLQVGGTVIETDCDIAKAKGKQMIDCKADTSGVYKGTFLVSQVDGNPAFFPVDGDPFSPAGQLMSTQIPPLYTGGVATWPYELDASGTKRQHNFSFTSEIRYWFKFEAGQTYKLDIAGDDDVWVFVNKKLAVDLGGIHTPVEGSVTLNDTTAATYGLAPGNVYEVAVFQAERQSTSSTFKITLSGFSTAPSQCRPQ